MNIHAAMAVHLLTGKALRRSSWGEAAIHPQKDGHIHYRRFDNAAMEWDWKPSSADLAATDWVAVDVRVLA